MSTFKPVRAVTFDAGGTLFEPWPSVGHVYAEVAAGWGAANASPALLNERFARVWRARRGFDYSRRDWAGMVDAVFEGLVVAPPSRTFFNELYDRFALAKSWRVFDDVIPVVHRLRAQGIRLGVVSNWDERLEPLLVETGLRPYFDVVVVSVKEQTQKPDPKLFLEAARRLGTPPDALLHVGDSVAEDYEGSIFAGCQARWLARREDGRARVAAIRSLAEIESCLEG